MNINNMLKQIQDFEVPFCQIHNEKKMKYINLDKNSLNYSKIMCEQCINEILSLKQEGIPTTPWDRFYDVKQFLYNYAKCLHTKKSSSFQTATNVSKQNYLDQQYLSDQKTHDNSDVSSEGTGSSNQLISEIQYRINEEISQQSDVIDEQSLSSIQESLQKTMKQVQNIKRKLENACKQCDKFSKKIENILEQVQVGGELKKEEKENSDKKEEEIIENIQEQFNNIFSIDISEQKSCDQFVKKVQDLVKNCELNYVKKQNKKINIINNNNLIMKQSKNNREITINIYGLPFNKSIDLEKSSIHYQKILTKSETQVKEFLKSFKTNLKDLQPKFNLNLWQEFQIQDPRKQKIIKQREIEKEDENSWQEDEDEDEEDYQQENDIYARDNMENYSEEAKNNSESRYSFYNDQLYISNNNRGINQVSNRRYGRWKKDVKTQNMKVMIPRNRQENNIKLHTPNDAADGETNNKSKNFNTIKETIEEFQKGQEKTNLTIEAMQNNLKNLVDPIEMDQFLAPKKFSFENDKHDDLINHNSFSSIDGSSNSNTVDLEEFKIGPENIISNMANKQVLSPFLSQNQ